MLLHQSSSFGSDARSELLHTRANDFEVGHVPREAFLALRDVVVALQSPPSCENAAKMKAREGHLAVAQKCDDFRIGMLGRSLRMGAGGWQQRSLTNVGVRTRLH